MMDLSIIFEDESLLVLDKPPGISVTDDGVKESEDTISKILVRDFKIKASRGGIVHRLDKDTSGLLLVAKTEEMVEVLQAQFKQRSIKKTYQALVHGTVEEGGVVEGSIQRNPENRFKFTVDALGKDAVTEYEPIQKYELSDDNLEEIFSDLNTRDLKKLITLNYQFFTLLDCFPKTGRTHQIRVHLKHIGHPIAGDEKYVGRKTARLDEKWCPRQFLHAAKLEFDHPVTKKRMSFESPTPEDLKKVLSNLEIKNG